MNTIVSDTIHYPSIRTFQSITKSFQSNALFHNNATLQSNALSNAQAKQVLHSSEQTQKMTGPKLFIILAGPNANWPKL